MEAYDECRGAFANAMKLLSGVNLKPGPHCLCITGFAGSAHSASASFSVLLLPSGWERRFGACSPLQGRSWSCLQGLSPSC